jgi:hypothetical protein
MVHHSNTLSSPEYLLEVSRRVPACTMLQQWLAETDLPDLEKRQKHQLYAVMRQRGLRDAVFRGILSGQKPAILALVRTLLEDPRASILDRCIGMTASLSGTRWVARIFGRALKSLCRGRGGVWSNPVSPADLVGLFPECAEMVRRKT